MLPVRRPRRDLITYVADRPGHDLRYAIDARKIRRELGWEPQVTFETGLRRTIEWFLGNQTWWQPLRAAVYDGQRLGLGADRISPAGWRSWHREKTTKVSRAPPILVFGSQRSGSDEPARSDLPAGWTVRTAGRAEGDITDAASDVERSSQQAAPSGHQRRRLYRRGPGRERAEAAFAVNRDGASHVAEACASQEPADPPVHRLRVRRQGVRPCLSRGRSDRSAERLRHQQGGRREGGARRGHRATPSSGLPGSTARTARTSSARCSAWVRSGRNWASSPTSTAARRRLPTSPSAGRHGRSAC